MNTGKTELNTRLCLRSSTAAESVSAMENQMQSGTEDFPHPSWEKSVPMSLVADVALALIPLSKNYQGPSTRPLFLKRLSKESMSCCGKLAGHNPWQGQQLARQLGPGGEDVAKAGWDGLKDLSVAAQLGKPLLSQSQERASHFPSQACLPFDQAGSCCGGLA